jgi:predicted RNase H-like HicB family nuclease
MKTIAGYVVLTCSLHQEKDQWVSICPELGISSFGSTIDEAKNSLHELVTLHINTLEDIGERARVFKEHHIEIRTAKPKKSSVEVETSGKHYAMPCIYPLREPVLA